MHLLFDEFLRIECWFIFACAINLLDLSTATAYGDKTPMVLVLFTFYAVTIKYIGSHYAKTRKHEMTKPKTTALFILDLTIFGCYRA